MTTERLSILAGAVALRRFTASQLAAFTGANPNTVRQVLRREQDSRGLFCREASQRGLATVWRLESHQLGAVLSELADEESRIRSLHEMTSPQQNHFDGENIDVLRRAQFYLASAEEAVHKSYEIPDRDQRRKLTEIALTLVSAANPGSRDSPADFSGDWWASTVQEPRTRLAETPLQNVSSVGMGGLTAAPSHRARQQSEIELTRRRARRIVVFANLSARQAVGETVGPDELRRAAEVISESSDVLPLQDTLNWVKIFIDASSESGNLPPVAIVTKSTRAPDELFLGEVKSWHRFQSPELAPTGHAVWVEQWAETLLESNLIPGVVVSHDDSPESDQALSAVMAHEGGSRITRPVIVASTALDIDDVSVKVAQEGGVFLAIRNSVDRLAPTVRHVVERALTIEVDENWVRAASSEVLRNQLADLRDATYALDIFETLNSANFDSSDLDDAQRILTALNRVFAAQEQEESHTAGPETLMGVVESLRGDLADVGNLQQGITVLQQAVSANRRLIDLQDKDVYQAYRSAMLRAPTAVAQRSEIREAMDWVYQWLMLAAD